MKKRRSTRAKKSMPYSVNQLAELAGVTVRTLHHYDAVGLLRPARGTRNGYRQYGNAELLRLQQILFFREIDLPLEEIKGILDRPGFDLAHALRDHRELIARKRKRLDSLLTTIDQTIAKLTKIYTIYQNNNHQKITKHLQTIPHIKI
jgi:DNA-binding transcriptional MerR regulator